MFGIVIAGPILFLIFSVVLVLDGLNDNINKADVGIVLGNAVHPNGQPSPRLKARLDKTVQLYHQGIFSNVIASGGIGVEGFDEALVMKQYLMTHGVPESHILADSSGRTTYLTAQYSAHMMKARHWKSALIISQYFHVPRTRLALKQFGILTVYSAHADFFESRDIYSTAREVIGYAVYLFRKPQTSVLLPPVFHLEPPSN